MKNLRANIKTMAIERNISELEAITLAQSGAALAGDESMVEALCIIKLDYIAI